MSDADHVVYRSQAGNMIDRQRAYANDDMAFLTVLDDTIDNVIVEFEVRNLILRRPRITIKCAHGTPVQAIHDALIVHGWNDTTFELWWKNNGERLASRRQLS